MIIDFKKYTKSIRKIDIFAQPIDLLIGKDSGHHTICGFFLTLALGVIVITLLYQSLIQLLYHSNPITSINNVFTPQPLPTQLLPSNFTLQITLADANNIIFINESIFVMQAQLVHKYSEYDNLGVATVKWNYTTLPMVVCNQNSYQQTNLKQYFLSFNPSQYFCIDWSQVNDISLIGTYDQESYQFVQFDFYLCNNFSTKAVCMERQALLDYTKQLAFTLDISSATVDLRNAYQPNTQVGQNLFTSLSSQLYKTLNIFMQPIHTETDYGYITTDIQTETSLAFSRTIEQVAPAGNNDLFLSVFLRLDTNTVTNYRSYQKLQAIFGYIGGIIQIFYILLSVLYEPFRILSMKLKIINSLFNFETDDISEEESKKPVVGDSISGLPMRKKYQEQSAINIQENSKQKIADISTKKGSLALTKQIKQFLTKNTKLTLNPRDFCRLVCSFIFNKCKQMNSKTKVLKDQIKFALTRVDRSLDILYIIKKLNEIDRLKSLLLDQDQINLFDYLPKPTISKQPFADKSLIDQSFFSILKCEKSIFQNTSVAAKSFYRIKSSKDAINTKLIEQLNSNILELFQLQMLDNQQGDSDCEYGGEMNESQHQSEISRKFESIIQIIMISRDDYIEFKTLNLKPECYLIVDNQEIICDKQQVYCGSIPKYKLQDQMQEIKYLYYKIKKYIIQTNSGLVIVLNSDFVEIRSFNLQHNNQCRLGFRGNQMYYVDSKTLSLQEIRLNDVHPEQVLTKIKIDAQAQQMVMWQVQEPVPIDYLCVAIENKLNIIINTKVQYAFESLTYCTQLQMQFVDKDIKIYAIGEKNHCGQLCIFTLQKAGEAFNKIEKSIALQFQKPLTSIELVDTSNRDTRIVCYNSETLCVIDQVKEQIICRFEFNEITTVFCDQKKIIFIQRKGILGSINLKYLK